MALGLEVALVLRAKGGANFLMHTHGIGAKDANEATREAVERLDAFAQSDGRGDQDGWNGRRSGDSAPGFGAGRLAVCRGRLLVNYRLVGAIWVLSVSPAAANPLLCVQLLAGATRVLAAAAKGPDVTPDKLARRYPEVYLALGQLMAPGGLAADASQLLAAGEVEVAQIAPEGAAKPPAAAKALGLAAPKAAASLKSRLGVGGLSRAGRGLSANSSSSSLYSASADPSAAPARPLAEEGERIGVASFTLPPEAFSGARFDAAASLAGPAAPPAAEPPLLPLDPAADLLSGTGLEGLDAPPPGYAEQLSGLMPPGASDDPWGGFDFGQHSAAAAAPVPLAAEPPPPPPRPQLPPATAKQQRAIAAGGSLQLLELWRGVFVGSRLHMAGTTGEVLGTGAVPRCEAHAAFQLSVDAEAAPRSVSAAAAAAAGELGLTQPGEQGGTLACFGEAPGPEAAFARFRLPPAAVPPPLLLAVSLAARPDPAKPARAQPAAEAAEATEPVANGAVAAEQPAEPEPEAVAEPEAEAEAEPETEHEAGAEAKPAVEAGAEAAASVKAEPAAEPKPEAEHGAEAKPESVPEPERETSAGAEAVAEAAEGRKEPSLAGEQPAADGRDASEEAPAPAVPPPLPAGPQELLFVVSLAVRSDLPGPLRGVCLDLDVPTAAGELLSAQPRAQWAARQRRLRWKLYELQPGATVRLAARLRRPAVRRDAESLAAATLASLHAFGPPGLGLSGVRLLSGAPDGELRESRQAFHCEAYARPEAAKRRAAFGVAEFTQLGVLLQERQAHRERLQREREEQLEDEQD